MITTCVILNYNDSQTTIKLVSTIKDYNSIDYIVIVDNDSTDNSYLTLKQFESHFIHVILAPRNGGYGYGNNFGIKYAYEEFDTTHILIANPDVEFTNECVKSLKDAITNHKKCAIVAPIVRNTNNDVLKSVAWKMPKFIDYILRGSIIYNNIFRSKMIYPKNYFDNKKYCKVDIVPGSLLLVDAEVMIKYGMYDEKIFLYCEETILAYKLRRTGFETMLVLNENYIHHHSISINKTYKSLMKIKKILLSSKMYVMKNYMGINKLQVFLVWCFYLLIYLETVVISIIKKIRSIYINR